VYLGVSMICLFLFATLALVTLYGSLYITNEHAYCERLTSEIMCADSQLHVRIDLVLPTLHPYEIFYAVRHLLFILYIVTVVQTL
jgi:hypothetical protein